MYYFYFKIKSEGLFNKLTCYFPIILFPLQTLEIIFAKIYSESSQLRTYKWRTSLNKGHMGIGKYMQSAILLADICHKKIGKSAVRYLKLS